MGYINTLTLIRSMVAGEKLDARALLSEVDGSKIEQALRRSKGGLPRPFACTNEPIEEENMARMPNKDKRKLFKIYDKLKSSRAKAAQELPKLMDLAKKFPNVPAIYNYLGMAYAYTGQHDKYYQNIVDTYEKFPNYLFGKISAAEYCLNNDRHKEVPAIFDNKLEIYMHSPETTKIYHISEARAFYSILGIYYARSKKTARAIYCYMILSNLDPDHLATQKLADEIVLIEIEKLRREMVRDP